MTLRKPKHHREPNIFGLMHSDCGFPQHGASGQKLLASSSFTYIHRDTHTPTHSNNRARAALAQILTCTDVERLVNHGSVPLQASGMDAILAKNPILLQAGLSNEIAYIQNHLQSTISCACCPNYGARFNVSLLLQSSAGHHRLADWGHGWPRLLKH